MDLTNPKTIIEQLKQERLRTKKYLGQHFLVSRKILELIIKSAQLNPDDTILEIGPGLGVLTLALARQVKKVIAVEKDKQLADLLVKNLEKDGHNNIKVINQDILKISIFNYQFSNPEFQIQNSMFKIVANLPYQVTSPILWKFLHEVKNKPQSLTIMVQKEVADRLLAKPGNMSLLSVLAQYYGNPSLVVKVKHTQFFPPPKVDSAVVHIVIKDKLNIDSEKFFILVKAGFVSKRKKLKNNLLALGLLNERVNGALNQAKLNQNSRAQELSIDNWLKLYKILYNETI